MTNLTPNEIESMKDYFGDVAIAQNTTPEEIVGIYNGCIELVMSTDSSVDKDRDYILRRAMSAMDSHFANAPKKGDPYGFMFFANLGKPKDWNDKERIVLMGKERSGKIQELVDADQVMCKIVDGKKIPVWKITKDEWKPAWITSKGAVVYENPDDDNAISIKEYTVLEGEDWDKTHSLIFRDSKTISNNRPNYSYSHKLGPRFQLQLAGIAYDEKSPKNKRLLDLKLSGKQADPSSDEFFFKKYETFTWYKSNLVLDTKNTTDYKYSLKSVGPLNPLAGNESYDKIDITLEKILDELYDKYYELAKANEDFIPRLFYLAQLDTYMKDAVKWETVDGKERKMKSEKGWDMKYWNAYGLMSVNVSLITNKRKGGTHYGLHASTVKGNVSAWRGPYVFKEAKLPGTCLIAFDCVQKPIRFDSTTQTNIPDLDNGDLNITVHGIANIADAGQVKPTIKKL